MRQALGVRKLAKYSRLLNVTAVRGLVRGGTDHRVDLLLADGRTICYWPDGTIQNSPFPISPREERAA